RAILEGSRLLTSIPIEDSNGASILKIPSSDTAILYQAPSDNTDVVTCACAVQVRSRKARYVFSDFKLKPFISVSIQNEHCAGLFGFNKNRKNRDHQVKQDDKWKGNNLVCRQSNN